MDTFEILQALFAKREALRKEMAQTKRDMLQSEDRAETFYLIAEMEDIYREETEITRQIDKLISEA